MTEIKNFRKAFRGFHREDVVAYITYLHNYYNAQLEQLNAQLQQVQPQDLDLAAQLKEAKERCQQLEKELAEVKETKGCGDVTQELEAYRRAERAERMAQERAQQVYEKANAVLADATAKAEAAANAIGSVADNATEQLRQYQQTITDTKAAFQEAVATLYTISPEE